jgi:hypothetical protein
VRAYAAADSVRRACYEERPMPNGWPTEHRAANVGKPRAKLARKLETRDVLAGDARDAGDESEPLAKLRAVLRVLS